MVSYDNLEITVNECTGVLPYAYWHTWKRNTCCDVISRGLHHNNYMLAHILQLPQKGVADLCLCQLATM